VRARPAWRGGARTQECLTRADCELTGWPVDLFLQHQEGSHWREVIPGNAEEMRRAQAGDVCCMGPWIVDSF
jgi:hypothetical protein